MAKSMQAFQDCNGKIHGTPEAATIADLSHILGGAEANTATARLIFEKRADIEALFADHDLMQRSLPAAKSGSC